MTEGSDGATAGSAAPGPGNAPLGPFGISVLGAYFIALVVFLGYLFLKFWPPAGCFQTPVAGCTSQFWLFFEAQPRSLALDKRMFAVVACAGAIGAHLHAMSSFADFVGNRQLLRSWVWWLVLRAPIGAALAFIFYFLLRGGLLGPTGSDAQINPYGFVGIGAMAGMFADRATLKLKDIFEVILNRAMKERSDPLQTAPAAAPKIDAITPSPITVGAGAADTVVTIKGREFGKTSVVKLNGTAVPAASPDAATLTLTVKAEVLKPLKAGDRLKFTVEGSAGTTPASFEVPAA